MTFVLQKGDIQHLCLSVGRIRRILHFDNVSQKSYYLHSLETMDINVQGKGSYRCRVVEGSTGRLVENHQHQTILQDSARAGKSFWKLSFPPPIQRTRIG